MLRLPESSPPDSFSQKQNDPNYEGLPHTRLLICICICTFTSSTLQVCKYRLKDYIVCISNMYIYGTPLPEPTFYYALLWIAMLQISQKCEFNLYQGEGRPKCLCRTLFFQYLQKTAEYTRIQPNMAEYSIFGRIQHPRSKIFQELLEKILDPGASRIQPNLIYSAGSKIQDSPMTP